MIVPTGGVLVVVRSSLTSERMYFLVSPVT